MKTRSVLSLTLSFLLLSASPFADTVDPEPIQPPDPFEKLEEGEHIEVGTSPIPNELREQINNQRVEKYQEFRLRLEQQNGAVAQRTSLRTAHLPKPPVQLAAYSYALHTHYLTDVSSDCRMIDTEDGARWEIAPKDAYKVRRWNEDHSFIIIPNSNWLTSEHYPYSIINQQSGALANAKLILGPSSDGQNVHWVILVDHAASQVYLENGTVWKIAPDDEPLLDYWQINHIIIIGNYSPLFYIFYPYDSILINVNTGGDYIHAKQR